MNKKLRKLSLLLLVWTNFICAQVGIGTTTPKGSLEIASVNMGVVMPRVNLTATNTANPVINPQGGNLVEGTMVYNLTDNMPGTYSVSPGLYFWNGSHWISLFQRKFEMQHEQDVVLTANTDYGVHKNIPNLTGLSFEASYDGVYQFILTSSLGTQQVLNNETNIHSSEDIDGYGAVGFVEGLFRLSINGTNYDKYNYSNSFYKSGNGADGSGGVDIYLLYNEITIIANIYLSAGDMCNYGATYAPNGDENIDNSSMPSHQIGDLTPDYNNLSKLNITYLGRN